MALADPQSITFNGTAKTLPSIGSGPNSGSYRSPDGEFSIDVAHYYNKSNRAIHTTKLSRKVLTTNPLVPSQNMNILSHSTVTVNVPNNIVTVPEVTAILLAQAAWLTANSDEVATKICGGES